MAVTKNYVDAMARGISIHTIKPINPIDGDVYMDATTSNMYVYHLGGWTQLSGEGFPEPESDIPTQEQLDKYPALKDAWEQYRMVKKLIGKK